MVEVLVVRDDGGRPTCSERRFVNEVGNEILVSVAIGETPECFCQISLYGPVSGIESYTTRMELEQIYAALGDVLAVEIREGRS